MKIKFTNTAFFDVIKSFEYCGPISKNQLNTHWSNITFHSIKIKFPADFDIKNIDLKEVIYFSKDKYWQCKFEIQLIRECSKDNKCKIYKFEVSNLEKTPLTVQKEREIKLSHLLEL
jgi:hypothetical protein